MHGKRPGTDLGIARIEINDFRRRSAVGRCATGHDWSVVIAFVNVHVIVAQAGWIGTTDGDSRLETSPVSWGARQSQRECVAVYAFNTRAFVEGTAANGGTDPIQLRPGGIKRSRARRRRVQTGCEDPEYNQANTRNKKKRADSGARRH